MRARSRRSPAGDPVQRLAAAGLAGTATVLVAGVIGSQQVDVHVLSLLAPAFAGAICGELMTRAADTDGRGRFGTVVRLLAVLYAVLAAAYAIRFVPGPDSVLRPAGRVLPPYAAAAAGAWLWTIPPRRVSRPAAEPE